MARRVVEDDDDEQNETTPAPKTSAKAATKPVMGGISLDDADAIDVGLFGSGPIEVTESLFTTFDYGGTSRNPPVVWLVKYERGTGRDKEQYEQPYTIGKGWTLNKAGALVSTDGRQALPRSCNAIRHLVIPLKAALLAAGLPVPPLRDPAELIGLKGEGERVNQEVREIREGKGGKERDAGRGRDVEAKGPATILEIRSVSSAPWETPVVGQVKPTKKATAVPLKPEDEDEDEDEAGDDLTEEAVEAIIAVVESGKVKVGEPLELKLEKVLGKNKQASAIIELATSPKFLKQQKGWVFDGKTVDAEE